MRFRVTFDYEESELMEDYEEHEPVTIEYRREVSRRLTELLEETGVQVLEMEEE